MDNVWEATLDDRFKVTVDNDAVLRVRDTELDEVILEKKDHFEYEPRFGPDVSDVGRWQAEVANFIDNIYSPSS